MGGNLEIQPKTLCTLRMHATTELYSQTHDVFLIQYFWYLSIDLPLPLSNRIQECCGCPRLKISLTISIQSHRLFLKTGERFTTDTCVFTKSFARIHYFLSVKKPFLLRHCDYYHLWFTHGLFLPGMRLSYKNQKVLWWSAHLSSSLSIILCWRVQFSSGSYTHFGSKQFTEDPEPLLLQDSPIFKDDRKPT